MRISLCMIARDEEKNIERCLRSVRDLVDDMVVVDTGSRDGTRQVAQGIGARVFDFPWCDDFSRARNESIRHARGKWILTLDADDTLPEKSQAGLRALLGELDEQAGYLMTVSSPGAAGEPRRDLMQVRLFPKDPRIQWELRVHEQIGRSLQRSGFPLRPTPIVIEHAGYRDPAVVLKKLERNLKLATLDCEERPDDGLPIYHRATILLDLGRHEGALVAFLACEEKLRDTTVDRSIPALKIRVLVALDRLDDARAEARAGLARYPDDAPLRYTHASVLAALGEYAAAERELRTAFDDSSGYGAFGPTDRTMAPLFAKLLLADVLLMQKKHAEADDEARRVLEAFPAFGQAWLTRGEALLAEGKSGEVDAICAKLARSRGAAAGATALRALRLSHDGDHASALGLLDQELKNAPGHPILLRTKAQALFASGEHGEELDLALRAVIAFTPLCVRSRALLRERRAARPE